MRDDNSGKENNTLIGVVFLIIGLVSAGIMAVGIYLNIGSDDLFYVSFTVNGITTTEYNPAFAIAMLAFGVLFALAFIVAGIYMMRKKSKGFHYSASIELSVEPTERGYRITGSKTPQARRLPRISIGIGILLLVIGGALLAWDRISLRSLVKTEAEVTYTYSVSAHQSSGRTYYADIKFNHKGQEVQSRITVLPFFHDQQVTVYYKPQNPLRCRRENEYLILYIILFSVGLIFTFGGLILKTALNPQPTGTRRPIPDR